MITWVLTTGGSYDNGTFKTPTPQGNSTAACNDILAQGNQVDGKKPLLNSDGEIVILAKKPGFFSRMWSRLKRNVVAFFRRGDELVQGHSIEQFAKQHSDGGGIEFTSKDQGTAHSNYTAKNPDGKSVNSDGSLRLMGNLYTPGLAMSGNFGARVVNFVSSADDKAGGKEEAGSISKKTGKRDTLIYLQDINGTTLIGIDKDSLNNFEPAPRNKSGYYNSNNVLKRK